MTGRLDGWRRVVPGRGGRAGLDRRLAAVAVVHGAADRSVPEMAWSPVAASGWARRCAGSPTPVNVASCTCATARARRLAAPGRRVTSRSCSRRDRRLCWSDRGRWPAARRKRGAGPRLGASASYGGISPAASGALAAPPGRPRPRRRLHRLDDVLADDGARVEVAQLEVGVLRAELAAQLVAREVAKSRTLRRICPACLASTGSLSGPKTRTAMKAITASSPKPDRRTRRPSSSLLPWG